ncbi:uncharacterized protein DDB_G0271670-like [Frankliniella occidentalis]|uniref:Uncharacterized protein DDB_G0271670-like n=1 Tax=Frankliniella occidentalis TaxID=133901 RepID=A0A6J1TB02_FRAOC|nr:uncharacterized protein DDB_G0271670-like [Frankliniella occidentalis]
MIDMTRSSKSKKSERKDRDKSDKKVKERLRKSAAKVTEEELTSKSGRTELDEKPIEQPSVVPDAPVSSIKSEPNDDTDDLKLDSKPVTNDSDSSYDDSKISTAPLNVSKLEDLNNGKEEASNSASVNPSISSENGETIPNAQPNQGSPALKSPPHDPESDSKIVTEKRKSRRSRKKSKKSRSRRYVSSDSGSDSSSVKVKSHRKKKSKRASSSDSSTSSSSSSSSQSSSSTSSDSSEASKKRKRRKRAKKSKKTIVKRNLKIYQPTNYLCNSSTPGAVKLQDPYEVYILQSDLTEAINNSSSVTQFIRQLTPKVYTQDALTNATPQGYPDRSKGRKYCGEVLPRLHRDGRSAILARARALENEKKSWRPRAGESTLKNAFSNIVHKFKDDGL